MFQCWPLSPGRGLVITSTKAAMPSQDVHKKTSTSWKIGQDLVVGANKRSSLLLSFFSRFQTFLFSTLPGEIIQFD